MPGSNSARLGHLITVGTDPAEVDARADGLLARVRIDVHPNISAACGDAGNGNGAVVSGR